MDKPQLTLAQTSLLILLVIIHSAPRRNHLVSLLIWTILLPPLSPRPRYLGLRLPTPFLLIQANAHRTRLRRLIHPPLPYRVRRCLQLLVLSLPRMTQAPFSMATVCSWFSGFPLPITHETKQALHRILRSSSKDEALILLPRPHPVWSRRLTRREPIRRGFSKVQARKRSLARMAGTGKAKTGSRSPKRLYAMNVQKDTRSQIF